MGITLLDEHCDLTWGGGLKKHNRILVYLMNEAVFSKIKAYNAYYCSKNITDLLILL